MKQIAILGSTGSIGRQTLAVVEAMPERFGVVALAAGNNVEELAQQILRHHPELVSVATPAVAANLAERLRAAGLAKLPEIQHGAAACSLWPRIPPPRRWFPRPSASWASKPRTPP